MRSHETILAPIIAALVGLAAAAPAYASSPEDPPADAPAAVVDLATPEGVRRMNAQWRYSDVGITEVGFRAAGGDGQPTGAPNRTYDITPHAGAADFDDSGWQVIEPTALAERRGNGRLSFNWYRIELTVPESIDGVATAGGTLVFETSVDDYAEVWVNGELPRLLGQSGGSVVRGWNAPNRLVVGRNVHPGQKIQIAVFGMNGPISNPVTNYVWMRSARLELHRGGTVPLAIAPREVNVEVERLDPTIDAIVPPNPKLHKLAEGFQFTEGPLWMPGGYLLFSDPNANRIYRYVPIGDGRLEVFRERSGYDGADVARYTQPGSNGLALDPQGRLTIDQHGNRRVVVLDGDGKLEVLADRYRGKRLNSPNDLVWGPDGALYFTDPPFGLPAFFADPAKELSFSGVYRLRPGGELELLADELTGPNGLAFSPDGKYLYVDNWDAERKVVMRYAVTPEVPFRGEVFFDMTSAPGEEALDGLKVDREGNLYVSGPGGLWILSPAGTHLGTIRGPRLAANFAWGDADGKTLYWTARDGLYRMRLNVAGLRAAG